MGKWEATTRLASWLMFLAAVLTAACDSNPEPPVNLGILGLRSPQPLPPDAPLVVEFSEPYDLATVDTTLRDVQSGKEITCDCLPCGLGKSFLEIAPLEALERGREYEITIAAGVQAEADATVRLTSPWSATFWTTLPAGTPFEIAPFDVVRHGLHLYGAWGSQEGRLEVGQGGFALISEGLGAQSWVLPTGVTDPINDVWCSGTGATYLACGPSPQGDGAVLLFEGGLRTTVAHADNSVRGVHGLGATLVYAVAGDSLIEVSAAGQRTFASPDAELADVWAYRDTYDHVVWVAGSEGLYRATPTAGGFDFVNRLPGHPLTAVAGRSSTEVVAVNGPWIHRSTVTVFFSDESPGYSWHDATWHPDAEGPTIVGASPDNHGAQVTYHASGPFRTHVATETLHAVHCWENPVEKLQAAAVGLYGVHVEGYVEDDDWIEEPLGKRDADGGIAVWEDLSGTHDDALFAIRSGVLRRYTAGAFDWMMVAGPENLVLTQLYADAGNSIYVAGIQDGGIDWFVAHSDGGGWDTQWMSSMDEPRDLWAADPNNIFVACDYGIVYHMGGTWGPMSVIRPGESMGQHLRGVWGSSADSFWVVGENGLVARYTNPGGAWSFPDTGTTEHLNDVWGASDTHVVAVGDNGTILHCHDGSTWTDMDPHLDLSDLDLALVWTDAFDNIWAASRDGTVIHFDGAEWKRWDLGIPGAALNAIAPRSGVVWLAGERDLLLRHAEPPARFALMDKD